jgi:hypothetical protein
MFAVPLWWLLTGVQAVMELHCTYAEYPCIWFIVHSRLSVWFVPTHSHLASQYNATLIMVMWVWLAKWLWVGTNQTLSLLWTINQIQGYSAYVQCSSITACTPVSSHQSGTANISNKGKLAAVQSGTQAKQQQQAGCNTHQTITKLSLWLVKMGILIYYYGCTKIQMVSTNTSNLSEYKVWWLNLLQYSWLYMMALILMSNTVCKYLSAYTTGCPSGSATTSILLLL